MGLIDSDGKPVYESFNSKEFVNRKQRERNRQKLLKKRSGAYVTQQKYEKALRLIDNIDEVIKELL